MPEAHHEPTLDKMGLESFECSRASDAVCRSLETKTILRYRTAVETVKHSNSSFPLHVVLAL